MRAMGAAVLLASSTLVMTLLSAPASALAEDRDPIVVTIARVVPAVPKPTDNLTLSGTITNVSDSAISDVSVGIRVSPTPLYGRAEIADVLSGQTLRIGNRFGDTLKPVDDDLEPKETKPFTVTIPMADLNLPSPGAYVTAVEALGDRTFPGEMLGLGRTFVPWTGQGPSSGVPLGLVLGWPMSDRPVREADGTFNTDRPIAAMAPGQRLDRLARQGESAQSEITWMVDPDLVESAEVAAEGYRVRTGAGPDDTQDGPGAQSAADWLSRMRSALSSTATKVWATGIAAPDYQAWRRAGFTLPPGAEAPALLSAGLKRPVTSGLALIPAGNADDATLASLVRAGTRMVVMSDAAFPLDNPVTYTPSGVTTVDTEGGPLTALLADSGLSDTLAMPTSRPSQASLAVQRFLAETLIAALEMPSLRRVVLAMPAPNWNPGSGFEVSLIAAVRAAPWLSAATIGELDAQPRLPRRHKRPTAAEASAALPVSQTRLMSSMYARIRQAESIVSGPPSESSKVVSIADLRRAVARTGSALWRGAEGQDKAFSEVVSAQVDQRVSAVRVVSTGKVIFSGETGTIPITIANDLDESVIVGLRLDGVPRVAFAAERVPPIRLAGGVRTTVEVKARVVGAGTVDVGVQLTDVKGSAYGEPVLTQVKSTAYSRAAAWVVLGSFSLLMLLVLVNGVRRRRRKPLDANEGRTSGPDSSGETTSGESSSVEGRTD